MKDKLPTVVQKVIQFYHDGFKWIIFSYVFLLFTYIVFFGIFQKFSHALFDKWFGSSFGVSFSASLLEDLYVFLILGLIISIVSAIISTKSPNEHDYNTRLAALFNSDKIKDDKSFISHIDEQIKSLYGFNRIAQVKVSIDDFDSDNAAYKIYTEFEQIITNPLKDEPYKPVASQIRLHSDLTINNDYGYVSNLHTFNPITKKTKPYINGVKPILVSPFEKSINFNIEKDEEIGWRLSYSIWHIIGDQTTSEKKWYYISFSRYTQKVEITLANTNDYRRAIQYDVQVCYANQKPIILCEKLNVDIGEEKPKLVASNLKPNDRIQVYIY